MGLLRPCQLLHQARTIAALLPCARRAAPRILIIVRDLMLGAANQSHCLRPRPWEGRCLHLSRSWPEVVLCSRSSASHSGSNGVTLVMMLHRVYALLSTQIVSTFRGIRKYSTERAHAKDMSRYLLRHLHLLDTPPKP